MFSPANRVFQELEYIRNKYQKPAYLGVKIKTQQYPDEIGVITGAEAAYVVATFEKQPKTRLFHPSDLEYIGVRWSYE